MPGMMMRRGGNVSRAGWNAGVGSSLSEEEKLGVVTDLVELFQQVNGHFILLRCLMFGLSRGRGEGGGVSNIGKASILFF